MYWKKSYIFQEIEATHLYQQLQIFVAIVAESSLLIGNFWIFNSVGNSKVMIVNVKSGLLLDNQVNVS